ncbi:MAG TPA: hypothetical protein VF094_01830 [Gaiellaceae bacterium]
MLKYLAPLFVIGIVVQIFLAGEGIFGLKNVKKLDDAKTLDPHRGLGFFLTIPGALLLLIVALLAWSPNRKVRIISLVLPFDLFVQSVLASTGRWAGGLHPVNGFLLLGLFGWLTMLLWRTAPAEATAPAVDAAPSLADA